MNNNEVDEIPQILANNNTLKCLIVDVGSCWIKH